MKRALSQLDICLFVLILLQAITLSNYTFLKYTFNGYPTLPQLGYISYLRLPITVVSVLVCTISLGKCRLRRCVNYLLKNYDVLLFCGVATLGIVNSIEIWTSIFYTVWQCSSIILVLLSLFFLSENGVSNRAIYSLWDTIFYGNVFIVVLILLKWQTIGDYWSYDIAFSSKLFYPYALLAIAMSLFTKSYWKGLSSNNGFKLILWVLFFLVFCFLGSRRMPLALVIYLTLTYFLISRTSLKRQIQFIAIFFLIGLLLFPLFPDLIEEYRLKFNIFNKFHDLQEQSIAGDSSYLEREEVWSRYLMIFKHYVFLGTGSGNGVFYLDYYNPNSEYNDLSTHNNYLALLVEHGVLGAALIVLIVLRNLKLIIKRASVEFRSYYFLILCIPIGLASWTEYNLTPGQIFYWPIIFTLLLPRLYLMKPTA